MNLLKNVKITRVLADTAAGTADTLSSDIIDMSGFEGVMFIVKVADAANTAVGTLTVQQDDVNAAGGMAALAGDAVAYTFAAADGDDDMLIIDVYKPQKRYLRAQFARATANIAVSGIIAIQYGASKTPVTQGSTVLDSAQYISPAEA
jgi:hypothetical protein